MRGTCALLMMLVLAGCSRNPPSAGPVQPEPAPVVPKEDARRTVRDANGTAAPPALRLATGIETGAEETPDAGAAGGGIGGKTVLHVGDSMVGGDWGLTKALEKKFTGEGAKFVRDYKVSESIVSFDKSTKLKELLAKHKPDIVILTLGTNDVFVPYPIALAPNVQSIVKRLNGRECYWMGPPLWKPDTGIVAVIKDNAAPCKFYDGSNLKLARGKDGIHPTDAGGSDWADHFWTYFKAAPAGATADAGL